MTFSAADDAADRRGDVARVQDRRRHLVEERLEQVVVAAIDERDVDGRLTEPQGGLEAAEPAAENDDARPPLVLACHGTNLWGSRPRRQAWAIRGT